MNGRCFVFVIVAAHFVGSTGPAAEKALTSRLHHLRVANPPEWAEFPAEPEAANLTLTFQSAPNKNEFTLRLRQQDVKQTWKVLLNKKELGRLKVDENDMVVYFAVPAGSLIVGANTLTIEQVGKIADDVRVGEVYLDDRSTSESLSEAMVEVAVRDGSNTLTPCRITVMNAQGSLMTVGAVSNDHLAVRPGVVYTSTGRARFGLPAGRYTIYAGRGFEYGIDSAKIEVKPGDEVRKELVIRREVPTPGFVSCDTHVHTLTYSGHGDATVNERVITIAGEGIELPIATDHNMQIDLHPFAVKRNVQQYFTPVVGNEVTTSVGHFNIFPVPKGDKIPNFKLKDWRSVFKSIEEQTQAKVIILNHGRDRHSGFVPLGPERHNALVGMNLDGQQLQANGMEVVNSGAQQTDVMRLFRDWMGLLNGGVFLTPVGASDSHDVARHFVGQGRTYIRCRDDKPGEIDVNEAVESFRQGRVLVSCGLLTDIMVNEKYGPGDLVPAAKAVKVKVRVLGPKWVQAEKVELFANGIAIREAQITSKSRDGIIWEGEWNLPPFRHDVHLVAIATGPGVADLYWPIAKPYQPTSPKVNRRVIGATGAVWIDADGDGKKTAAYEYAIRIRRATIPEVAKIVAALAEYDEAVATQIGDIFRDGGTTLQDPAIYDLAVKAGPHVIRGFQAAAEAWRECQIARSKKAP